jgi:DNA invertase Pin-like site-specific DNA recombinase
MLAASRRSRRPAFCGVAGDNSAGLTPAAAAGAETTRGLQLTVLKESGCQRIFREKVSGAQRQRTELQGLLDQLRGGDTLVVWKLDRLARSTRDLLEMEITHTAGAAFRSLSEPWADKTTHAGKMIFTVFFQTAEFERDLIRERTGAGRVIAKADAPRQSHARRKPVSARLRLPSQDAAIIAAS